MYAFGFRRIVVMTQVAQMTSFQSGSRQLEGYMARPEGDGPFPGIVIIHEIFGLNENMKDISRRFADQGYVALAVDLFAGRNRAVCMFRFMGGLLLNSLHNGGIHDLKAALTFLSEQPGVDDSRLGAVGYCLGGSFAIRSEEHTSELQSQSNLVCRLLLEKKKENEVAVLDVGDSTVFHDSVSAL